ncbi:MAG: hypothetical protein WD009_11140 [Phycisphaeraceae bacterium]
MGEDAATAALDVGQIRHGELAEALAWAAERGLTVEPAAVVCRLSVWARRDGAIVGLGLYRDDEPDATSDDGSGGTSGGDGGSGGGGGGGGSGGSGGGVLDVVVDAEDPDGACQHLVVGKGLRKIAATGRRCCRVRTHGGDAGQAAAFWGQVNWLKMVSEAPA